MSDPIEGHLYAHCETGTEGQLWAVQRQPPSGGNPYDDLSLLEAGDHLIIRDAQGAVLFNDRIDPDREAGLTPSPANPAYRQPTALGLWVHWTQRGWTPDAWARLFLPKDKVPLHATLTKATPTP